MQLPIFIVSAMLFRYNLPSVTRTDLEFKFFFASVSILLVLQRCFCMAYHLIIVFTIFFSD